MSDFARRFFQSVPFILLVAVSLSSAVPSRAQNKLYDSWEAKDGLPQNSVNRIVQTQDGYLWLSTEGGLSRFDGVSFTNFGIENTSVLKSNRIGYMTESDNGDLFLYNSNVGFVVYRDHEFLDVSESLGYPESSYLKFMQCGAGRILVVNHNEEMMLLNISDYKQIENKNLQKAPVPYDVIDAEEGFFWVSAGVIQIRDSDLNLLDSILPEGDSRFTSVKYDKQKDILWVVQGSELLELEYSSKKIRSSYDLSSYFTSDSWISSLMIGDKLYLIKRGTSRLMVFDTITQTLSHLLFAADICPEGYIYDVVADRENNLWFGTSTCGLIKLKPPRFSYLDSLKWETGNNIYPIILDSTDRVLMGTHSSGILIVDKEGNKVKTPSYLEVEKRQVNSITRHQGAIYFSVWPENHVRKWKGETVEKLFFPDSASQQTNAIYSSPTGRLFVGSEFGVYELKNGKFADHPAGEKADVGFVSTFLEDSENRLWIASRNVLLCYDEQKDSLVFDSRIELPSVRSFRGIEEDNEGRIFVGSYGHGMFVIDNGKITQITKKSGLEESVVSSITEDSKGHIWLTGNLGMSRLHKSQVLELAAGERSKLTVVLYNEQTDRLRVGEFNGGVQQNKCWLGGERYIFPTIKGAVKVDFSNLTGNELVPPVHVETVFYNDSSFLADSLIRVDYSSQRMDIKFTALSYVSPPNVKFKYMLEGYDEDWIDAGSERKTSYSKVPPGDYTFKVIASNDEGIWNMKGDEVRLSIIAPFYMTWWFKAASILILLLLTGSIVNAVNVRKRKSERLIRESEKQLLKALEKEQGLLKQLNSQQKLQLQAIVDTEEKERKRIAADLHDGIGQLLSSVKINLGVAREKLTRSEKEESLLLMDKSKAAIDQITTELRNISYNLMPPSLERFGLASAIAEEVSKLESNPDLRIHFDDATDGNSKFDPKMEIIVFRAFQELLNNALKHSKASEITIQLIQHSDELVLMVEDDGKGFTLQKGLLKRDSSGLKNLFSRIDYVDGDVNIDSWEGSGTSVTIEIPLGKNE